MSMGGIGDGIEAWRNEVDELDRSFAMWEPEEPDAASAHAVHVMAWLLQFAPELEGEGSAEERLVAATRRVWNSVARRAPTDGQLTGPTYLRQLDELESAVRGQRDYVVSVALNDFKLSYRELGEILGISQQLAHQRYKRLKGAEQGELFVGDEFEDAPVASSGKPERQGAKAPVKGSRQGASADREPPPTPAA